MCLRYKSQLVEFLFLTKFPLEHILIINCSPELTIYVWYLIVTYRLTFHRGVLVYNTLDQRLVIPVRIIYTIKYFILREMVHIISHNYTFLYQTFYIQYMHFPGCLAGI